MNNHELARLRVEAGMAVWCGGAARAACDLWLLPGFGDSHLCFGAVLEQPLAAQARLYLCDLPGHGASPPRPEGLTVAHAARLWRDLIVRFSGDRPVILLAHAAGAVIATLTARLLDLAPRLLISVEGSLTSADDCRYGHAAEFEDPSRFVGALRSQARAASDRDAAVRQYWSSLRFADPHTLWTLSRSLLAYRHAGQDYLRLPFATVYYWDPASASTPTQRLLQRSRPEQRVLAQRGHWPMVTDPAGFYASVQEDIGRHLDRHAAPRSSATETIEPLRGGPERGLDPG